MARNTVRGGRALGIAVGITALVLLMAGGAGAATLTVNASGGADYTRIQDAIDNASAGDMILVYSGTYYETVNVNKQLILIGIDSAGGKPVVDAGGDGNAITLNANGITLDGFNARNSGSCWPCAGILVSSSNNVIENNNASNNYLGIFLLPSYNNNTLIRNTASYNIIGIDLRSNNNSLNGNVASNNNGQGFGEGIILEYSNNNSLNGNIASNNNIGIDFYGSSYNILSGNNASNNNGPGIYLVYSSNYNMLNGNIANSNNNSIGIEIFSSSSNTLSGNIASNDSIGINLDGCINCGTGGGPGFSSNNMLVDNNANSNTIYGISLGYSSDGNTLNGNNASNNGWSGINLIYSSNNMLTDNNASYNIEQGIYLVYFSNYNTLNGNNALNDSIGIDLYASGSNTLSGNDVSNNNLGIYLNSSSSNLIYNNNLKNTNNVGIINSTNTWNITKTTGTNIIGGPYLGGNFWANPNGTGFSQTCADSDSDGICDSPFALDANNIDYLPLASAITPTPTPTLTTIMLLPSSAMLNIGETQTFNATALDQNNNPMPSIEITFTSSNTTVGTVSPSSALTGSDGNASVTFTAVEAGDATVNATNASLTGSAMITVVAPTPAPIQVKIEINPKTINTKNSGEVKVTIFNNTPAGFDIAGINIPTVRFGPNGAIPVNSETPTNKLILHFNTRDTGIKCGDTQVNLTGITYRGQRLSGSDNIRTTECKI